MIVLKFLKINLYLKSKFMNIFKLFNFKHLIIDFDLKFINKLKSLL